MGAGSVPPLPSAGEHRAWGPEGTLIHAEKRGGEAGRALVKKGLILCSYRRRGPGAKAWGLVR